MPSLPVEQLPTPDQPAPLTATPQPSMLEHLINRLSGTGGEERYQLWPEKVVRDALSAAHDAYNSKEPLTSQDLIKPAMDMSALAGTGGLAGADASLGSAPFLRPALKYKDKIYKAPVGGQHLDAIPADMYPEFQRMAMNGEDINHYNFGFMNHKGQFLDREKALDYAIKEGLLDPNSEAASANTLTSNMNLMADSSKPGAAIGALENNEGLSHLISPKSKAAGIGDEIGKFNPNGISIFKVNAPEGYLGHRFIYSEDGKILGGMQITKTPEGKPTVANTYVSPEVRRQGIATKLNDAAIKTYGKLERSEGPSKAGQAFRDSLK